MNTHLALVLSYTTFCLPFCLWVLRAFFPVDPARAGGGGAEGLKTLPVGVNDLFNAPIVDWGMIMTAGVMITVPTVCFFAAVQRYPVQRRGPGGVKG